MQIVKCFLKPVYMPVLNTTYKNIWDPAKAGLRGEFIATNAYLNKQERYQIKNLLQHKEPGLGEGNKLAKMAKINNTDNIKY